MELEDVVRAVHVSDDDTENFSKSAFVRAQCVIEKNKLNEDNNSNIKEFAFFLRDEAEELKRQHEYYSQRQLCYHENVAKSLWFEHLAFKHMSQKLSDYLKHRNITIQGL